jgi:PAS domain S-box-containing protein
MSDTQYSLKSGDKMDRQLRNINSSDRYTIIWLGLLIGIGFYAADVIIDVFVFQSGTIKEEIFSPSHHEIWMRFSVLITAVAFAIYVQILLRREQVTSKRATIAENFLNYIFEHIPGMVFIKDAKELRFIRINRGGELLLGLSSQELTGKNDYDFFPKEQADFFTSKDREVLESGDELDIKEEEINTRTKGKRWLHTKKVPLLDDEGQPIYLLGISEDITDAKQTEEELQKQQLEMARVVRLSTMGEMASSIAHELNQPLTALSSYCGTAASLVKSQPSLQPQIVDILERAQEQAHRASLIIRHLREFLGVDEGHIEPIDVDQTIKNSLELVKPEVKHRNLNIEYHPVSKGCKVKGNKIQIEQVLLNLLMNSIEALDNTKKTMGKIIIQTHLLPDNTVEITVSDNGPGIDRDIADKIFDAFETNKSTGLGMGLAISRSIIEKHGGKLWTDLQQRNGALFGFNLPVSE